MVGVAFSFRRPWLSVEVVSVRSVVAVPLYEAKAEFFRTLGHPVRIRVLELLAEGPKLVQELLEDVGVEASNLSQQLAVLRRTGLVTSEREGNNVRYACARLEVVDLLVAARLIIRDVRVDQVLAVDDRSTSVPLPAGSQW